jgi:hypothetical protein
MNNTLVNTLIRWGNLNADNKAKLECWLNDAILAIGEGKGAQLVSASGNGVNFASNIIINFVDWANTLTKVLEQIEAGATKVSSWGRAGI